MERKDKLFQRTPYNYDTDQASNETGLHCKDKSLAQQHFKDDCDINIIFGRYLETGLMPQLEDSLAYGDFTGVFDFTSAMNAVRAAEQQFSQLPARIKNRFDNDPQKLITFLENPENRDEAEFLQIVKRRETATPPAPTAPTSQTGQPSPTVAGPTEPAPTSNTGRGNPAAQP